jgi:hypothetical protein
LIQACAVLLRFGRSEFRREQDSIEQIRRAWHVCCSAGADVRELPRSQRADASPFRAAVRRREETFLGQA